MEFLPHVNWECLCFCSPISKVCRGNKSFTKGENNLGVFALNFLWKFETFFKKRWEWTSLLLKRSFPSEFCAQSNLFHLWDYFLFCIFLKNELNSKWYSSERLWIILCTSHILKRSQNSNQLRGVDFAHKRFFFLWDHFMMWMDWWWPYTVHSNL